MIRVIEYLNIFENKHRSYREPYEKDMKLSDIFTLDFDNFSYFVNEYQVFNDIVLSDNSFVRQKHNIKGKSLNKVLSIMLAVSLNTFSLGGFFAKGIGKAIGLTALSYVGGKIINAISPPTKPDLNSSLGSSAFEGSPNYGWSAPVNLIGQGYAKAITYGTIRTGGIILSQKVSQGGTGQIFNAIISGGEGEAISIENVLINGEASNNFSGLTIEKRYGTNNQTAISDIETSSRETYFTQKIFLTGVMVGWAWGLPEFNIVNSGNDKIDLNFTFPGGLQAYYKSDGSSSVINQSFIFAFTGTIKNKSTGVTYTFSNKQPIYASLKCNEIKSIKAWVDPVHLLPSYLIFYPNSKSPTGISIPIFACEMIDNFTDYALYVFEGSLNIKITGYFKDVETDTFIHKADTYLDSISQSIGAYNGGNEFIYQNQILLGIKALATEKLNSQRPTITWEQTRKEIWIYNPDTLNYEAKSSDNPSWIIYDLLHRCRKLYNINTLAYEYIVKGVPAERIDYDAFKELADYCDVMVINPDGSSRKRFVCNIIFDSFMKLVEAINKVSVVCRANVLMKGMVFTIIYDHSQSACQVFGMKDIVKDSFSEEILDKVDRANSIEFTFFSRAKNFERDTIIVYGDDWIDEGYTENKTQASYFGITEFNQAYEEAKYLMRLNKYRNRVCSFKTDIDGAICQVGDVIELSHELPSWGYSGSVISATSNTITFDKAIAIDSTKSYSVYVRHADLSSEEFQVINPGDGDFSTFTISGVFSSTPAYFDSFIFGETSIYKKKFIVIEKNREADLYYQINCIEYDERIYIPDSGLINIRPIPKDNRVKVLRCSERIDYEGITSFKIFVMLSWIVNKENYFGARIVISGGNNNVRNPYGFEGSVIIKENQTSYERLAKPGEHYIFSVYARDITGKESEPQLIEYDVMGKPPIPLDVTGFKAKESLSNVTLKWDSDISIGFSNWEIRFSIESDPDEIVWNNSEIIAKQVRTNEITLKAKTGTYLIKARNVSGVYSENYALIYFISTYKMQLLDIAIEKISNETWGEIFSTDATAPVMFFKEDTGGGLGSQLSFSLPINTDYSLEDFCQAIIDGFESVGTSGYFCNYDYQLREFSIGNTSLTELQLLFDTNYTESGVPEMIFLLRLADSESTSKLIDYTGSNQYESLFTFNYDNSNGFILKFKEFVEGSLSAEFQVDFPSPNTFTDHLANTVGYYSLSDFLQAVKDDMDSFSTGEYFLTFNREQVLISNPDLTYFMMYEDSGILPGKRIQPIIGFNNTLVSAPYTGSNEYKSDSSYTDSKVSRQASFQTNAIVGEHQGTENYIDTNNYLVIKDIITNTYDIASNHSYYDVESKTIIAYFEFGEQFVLFNDQNVIIQSKFQINKNLPFAEADSNFTIDDMENNIDDIPQIWDNFYNDKTNSGTVFQISIYDTDSASWSDWEDFTAGGFFGIKFKFRIKLWTAFSFVTPAILNPDIKIYIVYRTETKTLLEEDDPIFGDGLHIITFEKAFEVIPNFAVDFGKGEELVDNIEIDYINRDRVAVTFWTDSARTTPYTDFIKFTYTAIGY
ncbi:MAG: phage tail protein [Patescibacteria group bacterium]